jgi:hypothetical protein
MTDGHTDGHTHAETMSESFEFYSMHRELRLQTRVLDHAGPVR